MTPQARRSERRWVEPVLAGLIWAIGSAWLGHTPEGVAERAQRIQVTLGAELVAPPAHEAGSIGTMRSGGPQGSSAVADLRGEARGAGWVVADALPSASITSPPAPPSRRACEGGTGLDGCQPRSMAADGTIEAISVLAPAAGPSAHRLALALTLLQNALFAAGLVVLVLLRRVIMLQRAQSALGELSDQIALVDAAARFDPIVSPPTPELAGAINAMLVRFRRQHLELRNFVWDAAHQLRTPLAVLSARLSAGLNSSDVQAVRGDLEWMSRLVGQILTLARTAEVKVDTQQTFDLAEAAVERVAALAPLAIHRERDIEVVGAERPILVRGDAELAAEAISNLVENALSHTPPGTTVTVQLLATGGLTVADCGTGVPAADREKIFQRFTQGGRPTQGGAGLGLAIVADIMRRHGGSVSCHDGSNGGAAFTLIFQPAGAATPPRTFLSR